MSQAGPAECDGQRVVVGTCFNGRDEQVILCLECTPVSTSIVQVAKTTGEVIYRTEFTPDALLGVMSTIIDQMAACYGYYEDDLGRPHFPAEDGEGEVSWRSWGRGRR